MFRKIIITTLSLCSFQISAKDSSTNFFQSMLKHCGNTYVGKTIYPDDPNHDFAGKRLTMTVAHCSDSEIRIPFQVGQDKSRTWILKQTENGLLFKHDHRHEDGTPDRVTMYGGYASKQSSVTASFPADEYTAKLIPAAKSNVWILSFEPEQKIFTYYLERSSQARYKAIFDTRVLK
ncbi:hypothetical protein [Aliikangiella sp. G2MR2-5]|uniref:hypothetical protein n=1 Tax=Aliikangiella sp. G2MR2-5 TaxID=2788943 RepID=UPI0018AC2E3D|nr:hypothetical protein [Aliikangiella sp. G2MR2-5]